MYLQVLHFTPLTLFKIWNVPKIAKTLPYLTDSNSNKTTETKLKDFCITKIMPYNHSLHSQREVGFILIPNPCLMPYIKLWWHSKWWTTRRVGSVGSSETHLISRTENEMFRGVLTNCSIFCNRIRSCEKPLQGGAWITAPCFPLPVFYRGNKRMHIKIISFHITETKCWRPSHCFLSFTFMIRYLGAFQFDHLLIKRTKFILIWQAEKNKKMAAWSVDQKLAFNKWVCLHTLHTADMEATCTKDMCTTFIQNPKNENILI